MEAWRDWIGNYKSRVVYWAHWLANGIFQDGGNLWRRKCREKWRKYRKIYYCVPSTILCRHKFPLGCDGHVSKFPIHSLLLSTMEEFYDVATPWIELGNLPTIVSSLKASHSSQRALKPVFHVFQVVSGRVPATSLSLTDSDAHRL